MAKVNPKDIDAAIEEAAAIDKEEVIGLKVARNTEGLVGGKQTNKTVEGLAKRDDNRVYGKGGPK